ncbi:hypothetical protein EI94DRAFT_1735010 [Lactarius quietus]|nr:hypothetical protein EI94DRAFT_1735010 [Lactarius quietus]
MRITPKTFVPVMTPQERVPARTCARTRAPRLIRSDTPLYHSPPRRSCCHRARKRTIPTPTHTGPHAHLDTTPSLHARSSNYPAQTYHAAPIRCTIETSHFSATPTHGARTRASVTHQKRQHRCYTTLNLDAPSYRPQASTHTNQVYTHTHALRANTILY